MRAVPGAVPLAVALARLGNDPQQLVGWRVVQLRGGGAVGAVQKVGWVLEGAQHARQHAKHALQPVYAGSAAAILLLLAPAGLLGQRG